MMAVYFFDSRAIVKRYVNEIGTTWVTELTRPATGNRVYLARVTGVEVISAMTRQARGGMLSATDVIAGVSEFRKHFASRYRVVEIRPALVANAMGLAEVHALRGYDAVQLAAALEVHARRVARRLSQLTLVSADAELNGAAAAEGLLVEDPLAHP